MPNIEEDSNKPESGSLAICSKYYKQWTKDEFSTSIPEINSSSIGDYINKKEIGIWFFWKLKIKLKLHLILLLILKRFRN